MPVDIVIPVHDALSYLHKCVASVLAHTPDLNRIIFVDDASEPATTAYMLAILQAFPSSLYIRSEKQRWWTRAANLGLRLVRTHEAVLLNSDCEVNPGWLEELYSVWAEAKKKGLKVSLVGSVWSEEAPQRWCESGKHGVTGHAWLCLMQAFSMMALRRGTPGLYLDETRNDTIHVRSDTYASYELNNAGYATLLSFKSHVIHHSGKSWVQDMPKIDALRVGDPLKGEVLS
jgi:glycosyltransferase involved in cell wall biosynthesis